MAKKTEKKAPAPAPVVVKVGERELTTEHLKALDALYWAVTGGLKVDGELFVKGGHEYQAAWFQEKHSRTCRKKAAQVGGTISSMIPTIHSLLTGRYPQGVMYVFPTATAVENFSQSRFTPLIVDNPGLIGRYVRTNNIEYKRIGTGKLYFRGATVTQTVRGIKKDSTSLRSDPVDKVVFDEVDLMDPDMVSLALQRMSHSRFQHEEYLSTPTVPGFGIDALYEKSDQRLWMIKCTRCGHDTCLELEFPNCLVRVDNKRTAKVCSHCRRQIFSRDGRWVAQYPDRADDMVGYWISQLNSLRINPTIVLDEFENPPNGNIQEVYNSRLGMAYIPAENKLTMNDVYERCGTEPMLTKHPGPCGMGVDVQEAKNGNRVVVGCRTGQKTYRVLYMNRLGDFNDLYDIAKRFNVRTAVFDAMPEKRAVMNFADHAGFEVYGCFYNESQRTNPAWDSIERIVKINKSDVCDATHFLVASDQFELILPRKSEEVKRFAREVCNTAKITEKDEESQIRKVTYKKLGVDDYRHALNYWWLAMMRVGISKVEEIRRKPRDRWAEEDAPRAAANWMAM